MLRKPVSANVVPIDFTPPTVFVIDDDESVRDSLKVLIESIGMAVVAFDCARSFLEGYDPDSPSCLIMDIRLPRMSGLELQDYLQQKGTRIPIIFLTGHSTVPIAVRTMKAGAVDFLEKPFDEQILLESIQKAIDIDRDARIKEHWHTKIMGKIGTLSPREEEVLRLLVKGKVNKLIGSVLELSTKTVETHRAHIMRKLGVGSMAGLMWMAITSGKYPEIPDKLPFTPTITN